MLRHDYSCLRFPPIKNNEEGVNINKKIFNNIPHLIKTHLCVNCLQDGFVMYNDKVIIRKREVVTPIHDSMITVEFFQNKKM